MADLKKLKESLKKRRIDFSYFETGAEAAEYLAGRIHGSTVGIGGSKTVESLGLFEKLGGDNEVYWHWKQEPDEAREKSLLAKTYLLSANAIAETGEIVNIDGACNRVGSAMFKKEEVYIIAGVNKVQPDFEKALWRARNVAAPLRARSMNKKTPCAVGELRCHDCSSKERICNNLSVIWGKSMSVGRMELVLINEELGF